MRWLSTLLALPLLGTCAPAFSQPVGLLVGQTPVVGGSTNQCLTIAAGGKLSSGACGGSVSAPLTLTNTVSGSAATATLTLNPTWNTSGNPSAMVVDATITAVGQQTQSRLASFKADGSEVVAVDPYGALSWNNNNVRMMGWNDGLSLYPGAPYGADPSFWIGQPLAGTFGIYSRQGYNIGFTKSDSAAKEATVAISYSADGVLEVNNGTKGTLGSTITVGHTIAPATAPAAPAAGWTLYVDSGDANKLKAKAANGTVVTLGTP